MTSIILQGQNLTPDCVNVLRAILIDTISTSTKITNHPNFDVGGLFHYQRRRAFHLLEAIDTGDYEADDFESENISIFIHGQLLTQDDAELLGFGLKRFFEGSANALVMELTGFSAKHFKNLVEVMALPLIDLLPKDTDHDPIPE